MKTRLLLTVIVVLLFAFASSCGNADNKTSTLDTQSEEAIFTEDMFARHGISGIIPPAYITCTKVAETDENAVVLLTEYEFTVKVETDPDLERQFYYNEILSYLKQTVKNGNVYKKEFNSVFDVTEFNPYPPFEDRVAENVKMECHFELNDSERMYKLTVTDISTEAVHLYSLSLTYS